MIIPNQLQSFETASLRWVSSDHSVCDTHHPHFHHKSLAKCERTTSCRAGLSFLGDLPFPAVRRDGLLQPLSMEASQSPSFLLGKAKWRNTNPFSALAAHPPKTLSGTDMGRRGHVSPGKSKSTQNEPISPPCLPLDKLHSVCNLADIDRRVAVSTLGWGGENKNHPQTRFEGATPQPAQNEPDEDKIMSAVHPDEVAGTETVGAVLEIALRLEEEARDLFSQAATQCESDEGRQMFERLAKFEEGHVGLIKQMTARFG